MRIFCPAIVSFSSLPLLGTSWSHEPVAGSWGSGHRMWKLLGDLRDAAGADGAAALPDGEAQALLHRDRLDERHRHLGVVTRHDHLGALGEGHHTGHVRGPEVELRAVVVEER